MTTTVTSSTTSPASAFRRGMGGGLGWAVLSAASFGLSGALAKSLLEIGWTPGSVVLVRVLGAFMVLLVPCLILLRGVRRPSAPAMRRMVVYGVVAVALAQLCYFNAVSRLSVGVALLLEYLAPVLLIGWHWWRSRRRPARSVFLGAAIAMAGMVLVLDIARGLTLDPVGVLWGLAAAVCLCVYFVLSDHADSGDSVSPLLMTTVGTGVGAAVLAAAGGVGLVSMTVTFGQTALAGFPVAWWVPVTLLVLVTAALAYLTGIAAVRRLGSSIASFVALSEVIFAVVFAAVLLGQQPTLAQLVGGVLMLTGIAIVQRAPR
ncbi:MAG TPA: EamA family transporter [Propionibacteriaceae bacterium]|nr:EamA family transporter [Propionibacteriaceae bacterium]